MIMNVPSHGELIHLKIQAAMREHFFETDQIEYLGERAGHHWYTIGNSDPVPSKDIEEFEFTGWIDEEDDT